MTPSLADRIASIIRAEGPIGFDRFQEMALYDPNGGYYSRSGRVGREGDFVTGASWHPAFARCLLRIAAVLAEEAGERGAIVDVGAGEGELLGFLSDNDTEERFELIGVERSTTRRARGEERVPRATFLADVEQLPPNIFGLVVAYELFDALPVRTFRVDPDGRLVERVVAVGEPAGFTFVDRRPDDAVEIATRLASRGASLSPGQILEVRPGVSALARAMAKRLSRGVLAVFDYGSRTRALYGAARPFGSLEAFRAHQVSRDVLTDPGSRDLTAWVDFEEIEEALRAEGLSIEGLVSQSRFLLAAGIANELASGGETANAARAVERNAVAKLVAPGGMGESLRVLVASRGTSQAAQWVSFPSL